jgi:non-lysosomal glucosylceramidase
MKSMKPDWKILKHYDREHLTRIALPLGGIGTGTVSLAGRGGLRDWELMNRPAKGYVPTASGRHWACVPAMLLWLKDGRGNRITRLLEGPLEHWEYEGCFGSSAPNHGIPRFRDCSFDASYPFGRANLSDPEIPVNASIEAFNPLIPCDADNSSLPVAILRVTLDNPTDEDFDAAVCMNVPNYIGLDGAGQRDDNRRNTNRFVTGHGVQGLFMEPGNVASKSPAYGTLALATTATEGISYRTAWLVQQWGTSLLDFWDEFANTGSVTDRHAPDQPAPMATLVVGHKVGARSRATVDVLLTWHFPNRPTWTPAKQEAACACANADADPDIIGNHYCTRFKDAWEVAEHVAGQLDSLRNKTIGFVNAFVSSDLPDVVKEAALFNLSTLRSQTVFRTPDGRLFGWEGCCDQSGCCHGSCTHVWNYETATAFLFGSLACTMRDVEFMHATRADGRMSFRVNLPLARAAEHGIAAADGQMGCILKAYREWQLSGDEAELRRLWPRIRAALEFCWIPNGWDGDADGVMEGCQHNTMDVEYHGPNPQMQGWYLGALRAAEEMARHLHDRPFAERCRALFEYGSAWMDEHLFNGEYYIHEIRMPGKDASIPEGLILNPDGKDLSRTDYQLGEGVLIDQLVGQYMAHICCLGHLHASEKIGAALRSILRYNRKSDLSGYFNCMRGFALAGEAAMTMAAYPRSRPANPFPYFTEVMTGFEYTAAVGMLYEGLTEEGLAAIRDIRERYDGRKRNPFDEAECGFHYARAMAAWSAIPALTGFRCSAVDGVLRFAAPDKLVTWFWASGYAWGTCRIEPEGDSFTADLQVLGGELRCNKLIVGDRDINVVET